MRLKEVDKDSDMTNTKRETGKVIPGLLDVTGAARTVALPTHKKAGRGRHCILGEICGCADGFKRWGLVMR
jgi:hypothetical protein